MEQLDPRWKPGALVGGRDPPVGGALVSRLYGSGTQVITIDLPGGAAHPAAALRLVGDLADERDWRVFAQAIQGYSLSPALLAYTISESDGPALLPDLDQADWELVVSRNLRGA